RWQLAPGRPFEEVKPGGGPPVTLPVSGRVAGERHHAGRGRDGEPLGGDRVISPMAMAAAGLAFFFDVDDFAAGAHVAIAADDASAGERREAEKSNETHHPVLRAIAG